jgi:hypothetical protein
LGIDLKDSETRINSTTIAGYGMERWNVSRLTEEMMQAGRVCAGTGN